MTEPGLGEYVRIEIQKYWPKSEPTDDQVEAYVNTVERFQQRTIAKAFRTLFQEQTVNRPPSPARVRDWCREYVTKAHEATKGDDERGEHGRIANELADIWCENKNLEVYGLGEPNNEHGWKLDHDGLRNEDGYLWLFMHMKLDRLRQVRECVLAALGTD